MGITASETGLENYTYQKLHVGMKREEAAELKNGIFTNYQEKFDNTDANKNGVIEAEELLEEVKRDTEKAKSSATQAVIGFGVNEIFRRLVKADALLVKIFVGLLGVNAIVQLHNRKQLKKEVAMLEELIRNQERLEQPSTLCQKDTEA